MRPLLTRVASRAVDADAINRLGVPGLVLMENAGYGAARRLLARFGQRLGSPVIIGGTGQNGGDAWVIARQLWLRGVRPRAILVGSPERVTGDARINLEALEKLGCQVLVVDADLTALTDALGRATLVVDGLFGTGLDRPLAGVHTDVVSAINRADAPVFALDLPSGIDADSGAVLGDCVKAQFTVAFGALKRGLYQHPGRLAAGEIECVPIGVPGPREAPCQLLGDEDVAAALPVRAADAHKGTGGHVLVIAGSEGKTGAALLAGQGALCCGAGLVTIATAEQARARLDGRIPELMTAGLADDAAGAVAFAKSFGGRCGSAVLGPGFGLGEWARSILVELSLALEIPAVVDADALTAFEGQLERLRGAVSPRVLTPHPGEAARLLGTEPASVQSDRFAAAQALSERCGQPVVLKGAGTIVAYAGQMRVCDAGTPAMASAGMGDVLAGMLGALLVKCDGFGAAEAAVQLHARAGELAACADRGLRASQVAASVPAALTEIRSH